LNNGVKIISILSGKGGVGKSILSFNMAERLASMGLKTLLVDADINFGNLHILANVNAEYGVKQFADKTLSLKEATTRINNNLDILASSGGTVDFDYDNVKAAANMVKNLRQQARDYDLIIIDHSSGVSKTATIMAHASDLNLLVLVPELTSISDCYGLFKHLKKTDSAINCRIIVNRITASEDPDYLFSKFCAISERFIGTVPVIFGYVPESELFRKSIAAQSAISAVNIESAAAQAVTELAVNARRLLGLSAKKVQFNNLQTINKTTAFADIKE